jgi:PAS domain S-box-containing protein
MTEHSTDVIVLTDVVGRRLYVSPAVQAVFGYTPEEFVRKTWHDMIIPDDAERVRAELAHQAQTGERSTVSYRAHRADGREIWVDALVCTFKDADFQRVGALLPVDGKIDGGLDGHSGPRRHAARRLASQARRAGAGTGEHGARLAGVEGRVDRPRQPPPLRRSDSRGVDRCSRAGQPLSVVMLDVDHFKAFNDEHGHQQGDHRLVEVAGAIADALYRPRDIAVRLWR